MVALRLFAMSAILLTANSLLAQVTVQLPTYRFFGMTTSVIVPDGGTANLGGVSSGSWGSSQYAPPLVRSFSPNRGYAGGTSTGTVSTTVWIHDHEAMDKAVLKSATSGKAAEDVQRQTLSQQTITTANAQKLTAAPTTPTLSLKEIARQKAAQKK